MKHNKWMVLALLAFALIPFTQGCREDPPAPDPQPGNTVLSYGDSIIYLRSSGSNVISPRPMGKTGTFSAWPEGLKIDGISGAITVNESETGLRYKVMFVPDGTRDTLSTKIVLSGVNYKDHYHIQTVNDSLSRPFYNAYFNQFTLPAGCSFDVTGSARARGLAIDPVTGIINLNQTIRNGFFGNIPARDRDKNTADIYYRIPDGSGNTINHIEVKLYFYTDMTTVETELTDLLQDRTTMFMRMAQDIFAPVSNMARPAVASRPRPPCVVILGR